MPAANPPPKSPQSPPPLQRAGLLHRPAVRAVGMAQPLIWLRKGWHDLLRCPLPGLVHGLVAALFGLAVVWWAHDDFWIMAGAFSGFLIVAPIVATGLYAISRALQRGQPHPGLGDVVRVWRTRDPRLMHFGLLLGLAGTGWVMTSASMITSFAEVPITQPLDFLRYVVAQDNSWLFEAWLMLGGVLAAPVFASSVVAIPLLLDRKATVLQAVLTSWDAVLASPGPLALWAALLLGLSALGMASFLVGLVVVAPWLSHASWHAYCDLVGAASDAEAADTI